MSSVSVCVWVGGGVVCLLFVVFGWWLGRDRDRNVELLSAECSVHAKRQKLRLTDRRPGGELESGGEGTRRAPNVN